MGRGGERTRRAVHGGERDTPRAVHRRTGRTRRAVSGFV